MGVLLKVLAKVAVVWSVFIIVSDAQSTEFTEYSSSSLSCSTPCAVKILSVIGDIKSENEQLKREVAGHYEETKQNKKTIEDLRHLVADVMEIVLANIPVTLSPISRLIEAIVTTESTPKLTPQWTETTTHTTTVSVPVTQRKSCTSYCSGGSRLGAVCVNGYCECSGTDYNKYTCLPEVGSCMILRNQLDALATPNFIRRTLSCAPRANSQFEVHIIGNYQNQNIRPVQTGPVASLSLEKIGAVSKDVVLVLTNYEPVSWELTVPSGVQIHKVQLYSYYIDYSSVKFVNGTDLPSGIFERKSRNFGYGDDSGGGSTTAVLREVHSDFGGITSFTGTYQADQWVLKIGDPTVPAEVPFGQKKFLDSSTFYVPEGVTLVDVICIGGGGGGRDNQHPTSFGGHGGNSTFGEYLHAEGGFGAYLNNSGGQGGWGFIAFGGDGGVGGSCSAGAGAAGETIPGDRRLIPGSSEYPFCGGGGSSDCLFDNITAATSGPGGERPMGRHGGKYGGGGGSKGGGRAGGGGGYSRKVVPVTAGEEIQIIVGKAGSPSYSEGEPADGIVVVSWGGNINPSKYFYEITL